MAFLTDRTLTTGLTTSDLIHIVNPNDTSQNPAGSSYKATLGQFVSLIPPFTGGSGNCITDFYVTNIYGCSPITIHSETNFNGSTASGTLSFAQGQITTAPGNYSHSQGRLTNSIGDWSHSEGRATNSTGTYSHAEGVGTLSSGNSSHSEGDGTESSGFASHAEGQDTNALGNAAHSEGRETLAYEYAAHSEGYQTSAMTLYSHSEGYQTIAYGLGSHVEGYGSVSNGNYQHVQGQFNLTSSTQSAFIIGNGSDDLNRSNLVYAAGNQVDVYGDLIVTGLTQTNGITSTSRITFPQRTIGSAYTATTDDFMIDVSGGTFSVTLPSAIGIKGRILAISNNGTGLVTVQPILGQTIDGKSYISLGLTNALQLSSDGVNWTTISYNLSTINSSTGVFSYTGATTASTTSFYVSPVKGWIVDEVSNPLSPQLIYIDYTGGTHTAIYVTSSTQTWFYITSGNTIAQSNIPLTEQQRRENIFLGKLGHANKTSIVNVFNSPDQLLSPIAQLRDMFDPIQYINGGIYPSANGVNLNFNTSAAYLYGLGINFTNNILQPNSFYVSGNSPTTFQYRTQTGGTAANTTLIDPNNYDVGGVVTAVGGGANASTNQRIFVLANGQIRVQYGQTVYNTLAEAIAGSQTETFNTFSNFATNGILIGILSVTKATTNLSDTTKARFLFASKFGETIGAAGGLSTTTLQQAYNNSVTPEIVTSVALGAFTIKNGTGNPDSSTNVLEGLTATNGITSVIRADGAITGTSFSGHSFYSSGSTGYNQLILKTTYTPSGTTDTNGVVGDIAWDTSYIYVKTSGGWKRSSLGTW